MSSAAEAELEALYLNAQEAVYLRQILTEMGHPQPQTPIQNDNTTAEAVINNKIQPKQQKQWTCASIGCAIAEPKTNSESTGNRGKPTLQIISQNTIHRHIMSASDHNF